MKRLFTALLLINAFVAFGQSEPAKYDYPPPPPVPRASTSSTPVQNVDVSKLVRNLLQTKNIGSAHYMVFWMPAEYFTHALRSNGGVSEAQIDYIRTIMEPYNIFWIGNIHSDVSTGIIYDDSTEILKTLQISINKGESLKLLDPQKLSGDILTLIDQLKPIIQNMLGKMGKGTHFFVYNNESADNSRLLNPQKAGAFTIKFDGEDFHFKTPLPALLPQKLCPIDGATMEGDWKFCPYHGKPL